MVRPVAVLLLCLAAAATPLAQPAVLAPYSPTPMDVVARMLKLAGVGSRDVVYDLGCGDGRIVIEAAPSTAHALSASTSILNSSHRQTPTLARPVSRIA